MKEKNQNKYNKKRAKILLKGMLPSFLAIFVPKISTRIIFNSNRNEFYNYNSKYLFEYFIKNHPEIDCKYVINDSNKRAKLNQEYGEEKNYFVETESLRGMWYVLRAGGWICSALETPVGGFFLKFNRFVYHVGHGAYFRSAGFLESYFPWHKKLYYHLIKNNFTYHLITSEEIAKVADIMFACKKEQLKIIGEPMNDAVFSPNRSLLTNCFGADMFKSKNILYAPTWRQDGSLELFPFGDLDWDDLVEFLEKNNITIYLRMHPSFEEDLSFYTQKSERFQIMDGTKVEDVNEVIGAFDMLITDYSSIFAGYLLLDKPLLFLPYDLEIYEKRMGFVMDYHRATPGPKPTTMVEFIVEIRRLLDDPTYFSKERARVSALFNAYAYDNAKLNAKFVLSQLKG